MKTRNLFHLALALFFTFSATAKETELLVKPGDKIAFMGDSITQFGARKRGFIEMVMDALPSKAYKLTAIPAGRAGNKSNDMLARLDESVISQKPNWMVLSCGVNDVWHFTYTSKKKEIQRDNAQRI